MKEGKQEITSRWIPIEDSDELGEHYEKVCKAVVSYLDGTEQLKHYIGRYVAVCSPGFNALNFRIGKLIEIYPRNIGYEVHLDEIKINIRNITDLHDRKIYNWESLIGCPSSIYYVSELTDNVILNIIKSYLYESDSSQWNAPLGGLIHPIFTSSLIEGLDPCQSRKQQNSGTIQDLIKSITDLRLEIKNSSELQPFIL